MRFWIVILLSVFTLAQPAKALVEVPTFRLGLSYNMINFEATGANNLSLFPAGTPLGAMLTLNPSFLWDIPAVRSRVGFHFLADIGSKYGYLSVIGVGLDFVFYPMGLSSSREMRDDGSYLVKTRIAPYFQFRLTPVKMSITAPSATGNGNSGASSSSAPLDYFAVIMYEYTMGAGADYPIGDNTILFGGLQYRFASFTAEETRVGKVSYKGAGLMIGIMTNFY